jgi:hypothetical protein
VCCCLCVVCFVLQPRPWMDQVANTITRVQLAKLRLTGKGMVKKTISKCKSRVCVWGPYNKQSINLMNLSVYFCLLCCGDLRTPSKQQKQQRSPIFKVWWAKSQKIAGVPGALHQQNCTPTCRTDGQGLTLLEPSNC